MTITTTTPPATRRWASVQQTADYLGIHRTHVYRLMRDRGLPSYELGSTRRFDLHEVDAWLTGGSH